MLTSSYQVYPVKRQLHKKNGGDANRLPPAKDLKANYSKISVCDRQRPRKEHAADRLEECCRMQLDSAGQKSPPPRLIQSSLLALEHPANKK